MMFRYSLSPVLKWAGGKRWLVGRLRELIPASRRLVEPFCGGLAVTLGIEPERALCSDINPDLINLYRHIQQGLVVETEYVNDEATYYQYRTEFNETTDLKRKAELFYYLNRTGFNGLCRYNSKGGYNVPYGKYKSITYKRDFTEYVELLSRYEFHCGSYGSLRISSDDVVYADPPYDTPFTKYAKEDFGWQDQCHLVDVLDGVNVPVITSNQATDRIIELYKSHGYDMEIVSAPRRIAANGDRSDAQEMLAWKNL
jgi:DNA adenine methylase